MKILILGANGMFAKPLINQLKNCSWEIFGTTRQIRGYEVNKNTDFNLISEVDFLDLDSVYAAIDNVKPDLVINLVGITKYKSNKTSVSEFIQVNSYAPNKIAEYCASNDIRFIHLSTDCVFSGDQGNYSDSHISDAKDIYGKTKALGEIEDMSNVLTIRSSFIGHNDSSNDGLLEWFLSNNDNSCKGFKTAIYSGLTTYELADVFCKHIIPNKNLYGIYNVSSDPISKYELLLLISRIYNKNIKLIESDEWVIDRSLDSSKFRLDTGYNPPDWKEMINKMHRRNYV